MIFKNIEGKTLLTFPVGCWETVKDTLAVGFDVPKRSLRFNRFRDVSREVYVSCFYEGVVRGLGVVEGTAKECRAVATGILVR